MNTNTSPSTFWIATETRDRATVLVVNGDLDISTSPMLEAAFLSCLREQPPTIAVDLANVSFMNGAGIRALLVGRARAAEHRARFHVVRASKAVERLMTPGLRAVLAAAEPVPAPHVPSAPQAPSRTRVLECIECKLRTDHVKGPTTLRPDGSVLLQWWSCTECEEGKAIG